MMVCVAIYAVLVNAITVADNLHTAIWSVAAYTVILCFSLFKTSSWQNQSSMHIRRKQEYGICSSAERFFKNKDKISTEFN